MLSETMNKGDSYAEWVRRVLRRARQGSGRIATLFDSSVPEPRDILADIVTRGFTPPITNRYTSAFTGGNPYVVAHLSRQYGVDAQQILCTTGATGALSLLYRALVAPGEHVLVETPGFDLFRVIGESHGVRVGSFQRRAHDMGLDVDAIAAAIRPDTRLIILSNLHNPSGAVIGRVALERLAMLAEQRGVLVVVDEVYLDYAAGDERPPYAATLSSNCISISSLTKIYGLSTLRCGWIVAAPEVLAPVRDLWERLEFGVSNLSHSVAAMVMDEHARFDDFWRGMLARGRPLIEAAFAAWRGEGLIAGDLPRHGCIAFPRLVGIDDTRAFSDWLCDHYGVIVAPGEYFGAPGHVRIGFGHEPGELEFGLNGLGRGLRRYGATDRPIDARAAR